jgi:hypothetical protein
MKRYTKRIVLTIASLAMLVAAPAVADPVKVARTISFAAGSVIRPQVQDECALQTKIPTFLAEYSSDVELVDGDPGTEGRVLTIEITAAHAPGGGAFSGPKSVSVSGVLKENGATIGNFRAARYSTGGAFGGWKGTCAIVGRCAKTLGKDIAIWLKNPGKDSLLGDAH